MKKILVSALAALAMVVGGLVPAANASQASASLTDYWASGELIESNGAVTLVLDSPANYLNFWIYFRPDSSTYASLAGSGTGTTAVTLELTATLTRNGVTVPGFRPFVSDARKPNGNFLSAASTSGNVKTFNLPGTGSADGIGNMAEFDASVTVGSGQITGGIPAGTYVLTPSLLVNGQAATGTYGTSYYFNASFDSIVPTSANADSNTKQVVTCVDTTGFSAGDTLQVTGYNNGIAGHGNAGSMEIGISSTAPVMGMDMGTSLHTASNLANGQTSYTLASTGVGKLLLVGMRASAAPAQSESYDIVVKKNGSGADIGTNCQPGTVSPSIDNSGSRVTVTFGQIGVANWSTHYSIYCRAYRADNGNSVGGNMATNGVCNLNNLAAATTYNLEAMVSMNTNGNFMFYETYSLGQTLGAQTASVNNNQVVVVTPVAPVVPVFKQPKFSMPSKIDVDATGKVSLSGKDMGVSTVLIGGKEQKIDTNSDEKLVFDTTGLAKGVHDLVMKGAFGTYTIQKAIQVGEAVVTKVAGVSARQVGMAGGELSISGVGLEGTTQITMNGQVLEIVSRTDSKVTFKVPASTVASVNSIMIEGSFVPVLFKNAFSYTK